MTDDDWIDADIWIAHLRLQHGLPPRAGPPLTYEQAQAIADIAGLSYAAQSDGTTLLRVGAEKAKAARAALALS